MAEEINDTFNSLSNGRLSTVSPDWTDTSANMQVSGGNVVWSDSASAGVAFHDTVLSDADHYVETPVIPGDSEYAGVGPFVRGSGNVADVDGYRCELGAWNVAPTQHHIGITRYDSGGETEVQVTTLGTSDLSSHTVRAEVVGNTIEVYVDSVLEASYTGATSYTTNTRVGIFASRWSGDAPTISSFIAGTFAAGGTVPEAITDLTGIAGNTQVALDWTAPADGGSAITDYDVDWALASAPTTWLGPVSTGSASPGYTKTGLTNTTAYVFRARAVNAIGDGAWSSTSAEYTPVADTVPAAVADLAGTVGNTEIPLTWTAPDDGGSAITDYVVQFREV